VAVLLSFSKRKESEIIYLVFKKMTYSELVLNSASDELGFYRIKKKISGGPGSLTGCETTGKTESHSQQTKTT